MRNFIFTVFAMALLLAMARPASAQNDPAVQFSPTANPHPVPNGIWSYGFDNFPLPNPFNLLTIPGAVPVIDAWRSPSFGDVGVYHNGTAVNQNFTTGSDNALYKPGELGMHPGPNDQYAVVQFAVPANGFYTIHGVFEGLDLGGGTNTLVDLLKNNVPVASGNVIGFGPPSDVPLSAGPFLLNAGDTLAFAVGGNPVQGSTGLLSGASVDAVPEPSSLVWGLAAMAYGLYRRRRA